MDEKSPNIQLATSLGSSILTKVFSKKSASSRSYVRFLASYSDRPNSFINLSDDHFLNKEELVFIKKINTLVKDYNCIQLFTNDAAFNYLLRKKSCTKFYFVYVASPLDKQKKFISELDKYCLPNVP